MIEMVFYSMHYARYRCCKYSRVRNMFARFWTFFTQTIPFASSLTIMRKHFHSSSIQSRSNLEKEKKKVMKRRKRKIRQLYFPLIKLRALYSRY